jgi:hypothetical protein
MKTKLILLSVLGLLLGLNAKAQDDRIISLQQLPQVSREFLAKHFPDKTPLLLKEDWDDYEVVYANGEKVEFLKTGEWKKVDCRLTAVPAVLVPQQIKDQAQALYPGALITKIKKERYGWEIKLNNGLEIDFNPQFVITDIDD